MYSCTLVISNIPDGSKVYNSFMEVIFSHMFCQATYMNNWRWWNLMLKINRFLQNNPASANPSLITHYVNFDNTKISNIRKMAN